jgi:hypothetical protein
MSPFPWAAGIDYDPKTPLPVPQAPLPNDPFAPPADVFDPGHNPNWQPPARNPLFGGDILALADLFRQAYIDALGQALADGRISQQEYDQIVARVQNGEYPNFPGSPDVGGGGFPRPPSEDRPYIPPEGPPGLGEIVGISGGIALQILGVIGAINAGAANIANGTYSCLDLIANGTSLIKGVYGAAQDGRDGAQSLADQARSMGRGLSAACREALDALIEEAEQLANDFQDLMDSATGWLTSLSRYDCGSGQNMVAYVGGQQSGLQRQIAATVESLNAALKELAAQLQSLEQELAQIAAGNCRVSSRGLRCRPGEKVPVGVIQFGPLAGATLRRLCKRTPRVINLNP